MNRWAWAFLLVAVTFAMAQAQAPGSGAVIKLDPALDALVSSDARLELVKGGFGFTEGTTWVQEGHSVPASTRYG